MKRSPSTSDSLRSLNSRTSPRVKPRTFTVPIPGTSMFSTEKRSASNLALMSDTDLMSFLSATRTRLRDRHVTVNLHLTSPGNHVGNRDGLFVRSHHSVESLFGTFKTGGPVNNLNRLADQRLKHVSRATDSRVVETLDSERPIGQTTDIAVSRVTEGGDVMRLGLARHLDVVAEFGKVRPVDGHVGVLAVHSGHD